MSLIYGFLLVSLISEGRFHRRGIFNVPLFMFLCTLLVVLKWFQPKYEVSKQNSIQRSFFTWILAIPTVRNAMPVRHIIYHIINRIALGNNEFIKIVAKNLVIIIGYCQILQRLFGHSHLLSMAILHGGIVCFYPGFPNNHTSIQESSKNYCYFWRASNGLTPRSRYSCSCFIRTSPCAGAFPGSR